MPPEVFAVPRKGSLPFHTGLPDVMSIRPRIALTLIGTWRSVAGENHSCTGAVLPPLLFAPGCLPVTALVPGGSASGGAGRPGAWFRRRRPERGAVI